MSADTSRCISQFSAAKDKLVNASMLAIDQSRTGSVAMRFASADASIIFEMQFSNAVVLKCDLNCCPFLGKLKSMTATAISPADLDRRTLLFEAESGSVMVAYDGFILVSRNIASA